MNAIARCAVIACLSLSVFAAPDAAQQGRPTTILLQNVLVFDGKATALSGPTNVLVRGNKIERISTAPIAVDRGADTVIISGDGRTLMPGLIDAHAHLTFNALPMALLSAGDPNYLQFRAGAAAKDFLLAGFTSARDLGGPSFGIKQAIDEGLIIGPRIWPSGAMISQTSGHADFRALNQLPSSVAREPHPGVRFGYQALADGVPEMLKVVRDREESRGHHQGRQNLQEHIGKLEHEGFERTPAPHLDSAMGTASRAQSSLIHSESGMTSGGSA